MKKLICAAALGTTVLVSSAFLASPASAQILACIRNLNPDTGEWELVCVPVPPPPPPSPAAHSTVPLYLGPPVVEMIRPNLEDIGRRSAPLASFGGELTRR